MKTAARRKPLFTLWFVLMLVFLVLFVYSSLNLKNIDYGYQLQELGQREKKLREEIDRLRAERALLLNLERVERIAQKELGFQYPQPGQVILLPEAPDESQ